MSDIDIRELVKEPPLRKRKVESAGGSSTVPKENRGGLVYNWWADEDVDPVLEKEYCRQLVESNGFDVDFYIPNGDVMPHSCDKYNFPSDIGLFGRLGLHCYNIQKGTNFQLLGIDKYNTEPISLCSYYITLEAMDPADSSSCSFQTAIRQDTCQDNEHLKIETEVCRLKGSQDSAKWGWDYGAIDDFYKGKMPNWLSDEALASASNKEQYYEVQQSDLQENDWLYLYAEFAFQSKWVEYGDLRPFLPLKMNKVVIQTQEAAESHMKLKANNAIFYMSFKAKDDPSGLLVDYRAIIRKTMDGKPGHIGLQVQCWGFQSS